MFFYPLKNNWLVDTTECHIKTIKFFCWYVNTQKNQNIIIILYLLFSTLEKNWFALFFQFSQVQQVKKNTQINISSPNCISECNFFTWVQEKNNSLNSRISTLRWKTIPFFTKHYANYLFYCYILDTILLEIEFLDDNFPLGVKLWAK